MTNTEKAKAKILDLRGTLDGLLWLLEDYPELVIPDDGYEQIKDLADIATYRYSSVYFNLYKQVLPKIIERYHEEARKRYDSSKERTDNGLASREGFEED